MFDIGASELLVIVIVAILVIGPKDMPMALRTAGRWIGKVRKVSSHFRTGVDAMIREAELEDMEKKWKAQNEAIMARGGASDEVDEAEMTGPPAIANERDPTAETHAHSGAAHSARHNPDMDDPSPDANRSSEPELPLGSAEAKE